MDKSIDMTLLGETEGGTNYWTKGPSETELEQISTQPFPRIPFLLWLLRGLMLITYIAFWRRLIRHVLTMTPRQLWIYALGFL